MKFAGVVALLLAGSTVSSIGQTIRPASSSGSATCAPQEGQGAQWLVRCQQAAQAGDGHAALMVGIMYWNGDGVPKDHSASAKWFRMADKAGEPRAPNYLGDCAMGRLVKAAKPEDADRAVLNEAISWYERAVKVEPVPSARAEAQHHLDMLSGFRQKLLSHR